MKSKYLSISIAGAECSDPNISDSYAGCFSKILRQLYQRLILIVLFVVISTGCGQHDESNSFVDTSYLSAPQNGIRDWLNYDELMGDIESKASPYHNGYFMPVGQPYPALHEFNGKISFSSAQISGLPGLGTGLNLSPAFEAHFTRFQDYLLPENRDIIIPKSNTSYWRVILSPGKVWSEPGDQGMSRASFPFVFTEAAYNTTLNGIATFLFDQDKVSNLRLQIVQQTAPNMQYEGAATITINYQPTPQHDNSETVQSFEQELQLRLPVANWQSLIDQYPLLDWPHFDEGIALTDISAAAIWYNDKLYMEPCRTNFGDFPYCRWMRHGVYSVTKPAAGGVALMFLAQRYGVEILDYKIADYLDVTASHTGWDEVTFRDCLNMATGIGNHAPEQESTNSSADENQPIMGQWSRLMGAQEKTDFAFRMYGNYSWGPGETYRYNSTHYFILSAAMDKLVRQREGVGLWQLLKQNVYLPIGIVHSPMMHTTETDGDRGVPILAVGLYPTVEDMIKISQLYDRLGELHGEQLLDAETVRTALFRTEQLGFIANWHNNQDGMGRYQLSFFGVPYSDANGCLIHVPLLSGSGGNLVAILPNGVIALRFADAKNYDARSMIDIAAELSPVCQ